MREVTVHGGRGSERAFGTPFRRAISHAPKRTRGKKTLGLRVCRRPCIEFETRPVVARMEKEA
jgi:hypothetical protein